MFPSVSAARNVAVGLTLASCVGCAGMPHDGPVSPDDFSSVGVDTAVPAAALPSASQTGDNPAANGGAFVPPASTVGRTAAFDGVSFRWHKNPRMCITRKTATPTDLDPLTLAPCAADIRQAFSFVTSQVHVTADYCLAVRTDTKEVVLRYGDNAEVDGTQRLYLGLTGDGATSVLGNATGFFVPKDTNGTTGTPILLDNTSTGGAASVWDLVGVGNVGGMTVQFPADSGNATLCMNSDGNGLVGTACDRTVAQQRWRYDGGFFVNDSGKCLTCTSASGSCLLQDCATVTNARSQDQRFTIQIYVRYSTPYNGSNPIVNLDTGNKIYVDSGSSTVQAQHTSKSLVMQFGEVVTGPF